MNEEAQSLLKQTSNGENNQEDKRCKCNKLICVVKGNDIEIKCNKCKRMMVIKTLGIENIDIV